MTTFPGVHSSPEDSQDICICESDDSARSGQAALCLSLLGQLDTFFQSGVTGFFIFYFSRQENNGSSLSLDNHNPFIIKKKPINFDFLFTMKNRHELCKNNPDQISCLFYLSLNFIELVRNAG